jgi:hypothetical protein
MNVRALPFCFVLTAVLPALGLAQKSTPDLPPPTKRQTSVENALRLTRPPTPGTLPADLPHPFNPEGFDGPTTPAGGSRPAGGATSSAPSGPVQPAGPTTDREIIETLAARLPTASFVRLGGKSFLLMERNRFEVGTTFTVEYNGQEYPLELIAINTTNFTVKYRNEEFTRPNRTSR